MEIEIIKPFGFCFGVKKAIELAKKAKEENSNEPVYILGNLVHNELIKAELSSYGLITLDEKEKTLEEWIAFLPDESIIVFSAHGHSPKLTKMAQDKRMKIYDATCVFVKDNEKKIIEEISKGDEVVYIGEKNHAESNAAIDIDPNKIHLMTLADEKIDKNAIKSDSPLVISQTTMSPDDIKISLSKITATIPNARIHQGRCYATKERQDAVINADRNADCFIILGSKTSNNTNKLATLAKSSHPSALVIRILSTTELNGYEKKIKTFKKVCLVSGASTPEKSIIECFNYLKSLK